jgi:FtsZ-interacting cell division protein ZipA
MAVIAAVAVVLIAIVAAALAASRRRRSQALADRFGPEYERTVAHAEKKSQAEAELEERARRVEKLNIRALTQPEQQRYAELWRVAQERFVDSPAAAVAEADHLVTEVMTTRGYPMADFEQRAADVSVDHPHLVENYRAGHALAVRSHGGQAGTEDLRQAMVHYRALFEELLGVPTKEPEPELVGSRH